jgi:CheY-like chemotaxis protein
MLGFAITIVSDNDALIEQLGGMLDHAGYGVQALKQNTDAYNIIIGDPPDALIVDVAFPECQPGIDLITVLKLRAKTRLLPLILTSANRAWLRRYTERLLMNPIASMWTLAQPFDQQVLLPLLTQIIGRLEREAS